MAKQRKFQVLVFVGLVLLVPFLWIFPGGRADVSVTGPYQDGDTSRRVAVLDGGAVTMGALPGGQSYPRAMRLRSGELLGTFVQYTGNGDTSIAIVQSSRASQGREWTDFGGRTKSVVESPAGANLQVNNAVVVELGAATATPTLLCAYRAHTQTPAALNGDEKPGGLNEGYLHFRIAFSASDDGGRTWAPRSPHPLLPGTAGTGSHTVWEAGPVHGLWEPFLRESTVTPGEVQLFYSRENGPKDQDGLMRVSVDAGTSWSAPPFLVSGGGLASRDGMMGVVELARASGHLVAVFESVVDNGDGVHFDDRFSLYTVESLDDGRSWANRRQIYEPSLLSSADNTLYLRNAGAPQIIKVGSTLVVSFMTDEDRFEGVWHANAVVKIITSDDYGKTWSKSLLIAEKSAAWAGLLALDTHSFLVLFTQNDRVKSQRVFLSDL
ncbi:hypothetical protein HK100_007919 [Physocladia obscura]|uniref:Sialidase domain-containing protein n=1 Tax=Physocladia obscura TaxID=109957 RepID=A0AAD5XBU1_9FUNG|nr:hypothetical protein HK100_007919 [Physocladia obscura]